MAYLTVITFFAKKIILKFIYPNNKILWRKKYIFWNIQKNVFFDTKFSIFINDSMKICMLMKKYQKWHQGVKNISVSFINSYINIFNDEIIY